ncbi:MAG: pre-mRNA cleavage complex II protein Pcf11 [Amphiamblys sp. WSBS2006]|nr:MAG: pre-mRNA cleavage complex II protein Pcf11 [Amphiamblys sp. WSBS2006]
MKRRAADSATTETQYSAKLDMLVGNSKQHIDYLTSFADAEQGSWQEIVRAIVAKIKTKPEKLPLLYLIDSICANIGEPYRSGFSHHVPECFTRTLCAGDSKTAAGLANLLRVWMERKRFDDRLLHSMHNVLSVVLYTRQLTHPTAEESTARWGALYQKDAVQCDTCGLRFPVSNKEGLNKHLDGHFQDNRILTGDSLRSRGWLSTDTDWLVARQRAFPAKSAARITADGLTDECCFLCTEKVEKTYDRKDDVWVFHNAAKKNGAICHLECLEGNTFEHENSDDR